MFCFLRKWEKIRRISVKVCLQIEIRNGNHWSRNVEICSTTAIQVTWHKSDKAELLNTCRAFCGVINVKKKSEGVEITENVGDVDTDMTIKLRIRCEELDWISMQRIKSSDWELCERWRSFWVPQTLRYSGCPGQLWASTKWIATSSESTEFVMFVPAEITHDWQYILQSGSNMTGTICV